MFLARVAPYRGPDRDRKLQDGVAHVLRDADDLLRHTAGVVPVSRHLPPVNNVDEYVEERVSQQIDRYYRPKAGELRRTLSYLRRALVVLGGLSVVLAAMAATLQVTQAAAWVAVITTITAALTAQAAASRLEYQQVEYLRTAAELERLHSKRREFSQRGPAGDDEFVQRCEHVISVRNEAWMAKLISARNDEHKLQLAHEAGGNPGEKN